MAITICVAAEKGGVGKTTLSTNLAVLMAMEGHKVLFVDMDAQSNATYSLTGHKKREGEYKLKGVGEMLNTYGIVPTATFVQPTQVENLFIIPSTESTEDISDQLDIRTRRSEDCRKNQFLAYALADVADDYDFIVIDTPPEIRTLTSLALVAADYLLIPFNLTENALEGLKNTDDKRRDLEIREDAEIKLLGIVLTMVQKNSLTNMMRDYIKSSEYSPLVFEAELRNGVAVKEAETLGKPLLLCGGKTTNPGKDLVAVYEELKQRLAKEA